MKKPQQPIPMRLVCPECGELHIDVGEFATKPHHTHACQECGAVWRPAVVATTGVRFLPGFKNDVPQLNYGDPVRMVDGPYAGSRGTIDYVDDVEKSALVDFGRGLKTWVPLERIRPENSRRRP